MRVLVEGAFSLCPGWFGLLPMGGVRFLPFTKFKCFFILRQSRSSIEGLAWVCRGKLDPHGCTAASSCPLHLLCCLSVSSSSRPWSTICNSPVYSLGFPTLVCSVLQTQLKDNLWNHTCLPSCISRSLGLRKGSERTKELEPSFHLEPSAPTVLLKEVLKDPVK